MLPYVLLRFWQKFPRESVLKLGSLRLLEGILLTYQLCQSFPRIRHFGEAGVGVKSGDRLTEVRNLYLQVVN